MLPTIKSVYNNFISGNIAAAQTAQTKADRIIRALLRYPVIPACKVVLEKQGFAVGNASFPLKRFTAEEKEKLIAEMRSAGLEI